MVILDPAAHIGLVRYLVARRYTGEARADLISEGLLAIVKVADRYDPARGTPATFLEPHIDGAVLRELARRRRRQEVSLTTEDPDGTERAREIAVEDPEPARADARRDVERILAQLPAREALLLRVRFGLDGEEPATLEEVGAVLGVSRERARQIEAGALRRARRNIARAVAALDRPKDERREEQAAGLARGPVGSREPTENPGRSAERTAAMSEKAKGTQLSGREIGGSLVVLPKAADAPPTLAEMNVTKKERREAIGGDGSNQHKRATGSRDPVADPGRSAERTAAIVGTSPATVKAETEGSYPPRDSKRLTVGA